MEPRLNAPRRSGSPAPPDPLGPVSTLLQRLAARVKFVGDMSQQMRTFRNDAALHPLLAVLHSPTDLTWVVTGQEHRARGSYWTLVREIWGPMLPRGRGDGDPRPQTVRLAVDFLAVLVAIGEGLTVPPRCRQPYTNSIGHPWPSDPEGALGALLPLLDCCCVDRALKDLLPPDSLPRLHQEAQAAHECYFVLSTRRAAERHGSARSAGLLGPPPSLGLAPPSLLSRFRHSHPFSVNTGGALMHQVSPFASG